MQAAQQSDVRFLAAAAALALAALAFFTSACEGPPEEASPPGPDTPLSPALFAATESTLTPARQAARRAASYLANYGTWDDAAIATAREHDVVIVHPHVSWPQRTDRALIARLQNAADTSPGAHHPIVLCYISIGEDLRTAGKTDAQMAADARFHGDGTGPRMDPRGPFADGQSIAGLDPLGLPSNGGTGYASYYLDDNSVHNAADHVGDGLPDRNGNFGGCFANAGDPKWFATLQDMSLDSGDGVAGLREILTTSYGRGLGCDGVFLDTFDTAAPNRWTTASSANESKFEWTAPGFATFVQRLRAAYPDAVLLQNRGLFFFNPQNQQYRFIARGNLDFVLFESYRLNSGATRNPDPFFYPDNRYDLAPRIMAEANRPDGFRVLSLGYAEGPADQMSQDTLVGASTLGYDSLLEDIRVSERLAGFRHYLSDSSVSLVNDFVAAHADRSDTTPPSWTSTYNDHNPGYPTPPAEATPRVGVQEVVAGTGTLTVRWDVALDYSRVGYALYLSTTPPDFTNDPTLARATRIVLQPSTGDGYLNGVRAGVYAYETTLTGLTPGTAYYVVIRAFDDAPTANEDRNQVVKTGIPLGQTTLLSRWRASNGLTSLTYRYQYPGTWTYRRVYVDRDRTLGTGFPIRGVGADLLIENGRLYRYSGNGWSWSWTQVTPNPLHLAKSVVDGAHAVEWSLAQSDLGVSTRQTSLVFQIQEGSQQDTAGPYYHDYTSTDPSTPIVGYYAENDAARVYYHAEIAAPDTFEHLFIDIDGKATSGYGFAGVGAEYMIENGTLYRQSAPGWSWVRVGSAHLSVNGPAHDWWVERSDIGSSQGAPVERVVFQENGARPTYIAPVYTHAFSP
jgi:hypothetical protein